MKMMTKPTLMRRIQRSSAFTMHPKGTISWLKRFSSLTREFLMMFLKKEEKVEKEKQRKRKKEQREKKEWKSKFQKILFKHSNIYT